MAKDNQGKKQKEISMQKLYDYERDYQKYALEACQIEIIKAERFRDGYLKGLSELVTMLQHCNLDADKPSDEVEQ